MFRLATGCLGLSSDDYYSMTPREIRLMSEGYMEHYKRGIEMQAVAVRTGVTNAMGRKNYKVFKPAGDPGGKRIDIEQKRAEWRALKDKFTS